MLRLPRAAGSAPVAPSCCHSLRLGLTLSIGSSLESYYSINFMSHRIIRDKFLRIFVHIFPYPSTLLLALSLLLAVDRICLLILWQESYARENMESSNVAFFKTCSYPQFDSSFVIKKLGWFSLNLRLSTDHSSKLGSTTDLKILLLGFVSDFVVRVLVILIPVGHVFRDDQPRPFLYDAPFLTTNGEDTPGASASETLSKIKGDMTCEHETFNNQEMEGSSTVPSDIAYTDDHVLVFFEGMNWTFELGDSFKAAAEKLGMGTYKAKLKDSTILVVNRFKEHRVMKRKFMHHVNIVGSIRHENMAPCRAYYNSKEEMFMAYDYYN
ncbi:hypothetical protein LguiB_026759 [Lonicera macranthoides]